MIDEEWWRWSAYVVGSGLLAIVGFLLIWSVDSFSLVGIAKVILGMALLIGALLLLRRGWSGIGA